MTSVLSRIIRNNRSHTVRVSDLTYRIINKFAREMNRPARDVADVAVLFFAARIMRYVYVPKGYITEEFKGCVVEKQERHEVVDLLCILSNIGWLEKERAWVWSEIVRMLSRIDDLSNDDEDENVLSPGRIEEGDQGGAR